MKHMITVSGISLMLLVAVGCGSSADTTDGGPTTAATTETTVPGEASTTTPDEGTDDGTSPESTAPDTMSPPTGVTGEVPEEYLEAVLEDAAAVTGSSPSAFEVVVAEAHQWPDGSLGCPEPDAVYPQVITPGYQVVLDLDGRSLDYRLDDTGFFRLCESAPVTDDEA